MKDSLDSGGVTVRRANYILHKIKKKKNYFHTCNFDVTKLLGGKLLFKNTFSPCSCKYLLRLTILIILKSLPNLKDLSRPIADNETIIRAKLPACLSRTLSFNALSSTYSNMAKFTLDTLLAVAL